MNSSVFDELDNQIIEIHDHSLSLLNWPGWQLSLYLLFLAICSVIAIGGRTMIIYYLLRHAPKERPINKMILVDQVRNNFFIN